MLQDLNKLGEEIKSRVDEAILNRDFSNLSRSIGDAINDGIDAVKASVTGQSHTGQVVYDAQYRQVDTPAPAKPLYVKKPQKFGSMITAGLGMTFGSIFAIVALVMLVLAVVNPGALTALACIFGGLSVAGFVVGANGIGGLRKINRYLQCLPLFRNSQYVSLEAVSNTLKLPMNKTLRHLELFGKKDWLHESHIDTEEGYLILSDAAFEKYTVEKQEYHKRKQEYQERQQMDHLSEECRKIIREGEQYVAHIRSCNDAIPDVEISRKLDQMEKVVGRIFEELRIHPEVSGDLGRLMNYYLPTTAKLLDAYRELDRQPIAGSNIADTKKEIEDSLDTLNVAFAKLLDSLFADRAMDISTDISVLNTILAQEGLKESAF